MGAARSYLSETGNETSSRVETPPANGSVALRARRKTTSSCCCLAAGNPRNWFIVNVAPPSAPVVPFGCDRVLVVRHRSGVEQGALHGPAAAGGDAGAHLDRPGRGRHEPRCDRLLVDRESGRQRQVGDRDHARSGRAPGHRRDRRTRHDSSRNRGRLGEAVGVRRLDGDAQGRTRVDVLEHVRARGRAADLRAAAARLVAAAPRVRVGDRCGPVPRAARGGERRPLRRRAGDRRRGRVRRLDRACGIAVSRCAEHRPNGERCHPEQYCGDGASTVALTVHVSPPR